MYIYMCVCVCVLMCVLVCVIKYSNINRYYRFRDRDFNPEPPEFEASARATLYPIEVVYT